MAGRDAILGRRGVVGKVKEASEGELTMTSASFAWPHFFGLLSSVRERGELETMTRRPIEKCYYPPSHCRHLPCTKFKQYPQIIHRCLPFVTHDDLGHQQPPSKSDVIRSASMLCMGIKGKHYRLLASTNLPDG